MTTLLVLIGAPIGALATMVVCACMLAPRAPKRGPNPFRRPVTIEPKPGSTKAGKFFLEVL